MYKATLEQTNGDPTDPWIMRAAQSYFDFWKSSIFGITNDLPGVIITGNGNEEFGLRKLGNGKYGVWNINDPNSVMNVLSYTTVSSTLDAFFAGNAVYEEDPRTEYIGPFLPTSDRVYLYREVTKDEMGKNYPGPDYYRFLGQMGLVMFCTIIHMKVAFI